MVSRSESRKKSESTPSKDAREKDRLISELKDRIESLEKALQSWQDGHQAGTGRYGDVSPEHNRIIKAGKKQLTPGLNASLPGDVDGITLSDILDIPALQEMADSFSSITGFTIAILDLQGAILVGAGWQDLCMRFHRCHPETSMNCTECDLQLCGKVAEGEYTLYKCKNGLWDMVTPIIVNGKHIANLYSGQFFFDDEVPDRTFFEQQAEKYGFDNADYLAAFDRIPRYGRDKVREVMDFYIKFARMVSQLSYSNVQLTKSLTEQKRAEEELRRHRDRLEELVAERTTDLREANAGLKREISERKLAEEKLRESEERFRALADNIPVLAWMANADGSIFWFNKQCYDYTGMTLEELQGWGWQKVLHPDNVKSVTEVWQSLIRTGQPRDNIFPLRGKDGGYRWFLTRSRPIRNEDGTITRWFGTQTDITERKRAEEALLEREEMFRALADTSHAAIMMHYGDNYIYANKAAENITGYAKDELLSMPFWHIIHPDMRKVARERSLARLRGEVPPGTYEIKLLSRNGEMKWALLSAAQTKHSGRFAVILTLIDVTERKRVEERLRLTQFAVDNFTDSSIWIKPDGQILYVNDVTCQKLGYNRDELLSMRIWDIDPYYHDERYFKNWKTLKQKGNLKFESTHVKKDGSSYPVEVSIKYLEFEDREYMVTFDRDITERKQAEEALAEAKARAELYVDLMGHDINNMNQSAQGFLELALQTLEMDGKIGRDGKVLIEKPLQAIEGSSRLISNVRKLQRLADEGVRTRPVDLRDLFEELKTLDFHVGYRDATINIHDAPHCLVEGSDLLRDVFFNIISNAVKHAEPDRPVTIDVRVEPVEEEGREFYRCIVEDDGPGVPDELKPRLFHRFQRGKTKAHGKGLGLYIVRTLVEGYHGKAWVEDRVKGDHTKGARFVIELPVV